MEPYSFAKYQELLDTGTVLQADRSGTKVLQLPDGRIVKFFRLKRLISSALLRPYAVRFVNNVRSLKRLGIKTVEVEGIFKCKQAKRYLVIYKPLPGLTLRDSLKNNAEPDLFIKTFIAFLVQLHSKGVFFRSVHFNNVIVVEGGDNMGLIDVADMKVKSSILSVSDRVRNFRHMANYPEDLEALMKFGVRKFLESYLSQSGLSKAQEQRFRNELGKRVTFFDVR